MGRLGPAAAAATDQTMAEQQAKTPRAQSAGGEGTAPHCAAATGATETGK